MMKRPDRSRALLLALLLAALLLTGCWDRKEIDERGFAVALGVDTAREDTDKMRIMVEQALPWLIATNPTGGGGAATERPSTTLVTTAHLPFEGIRQLATTTSRQLFFGHLMAVLVGEGQARRGLKEILDFLNRDREVPRKARIFLVKGEALPVLQTKLRPGLLIARYLLDITQQKTKTGRLLDLDINRFDVTLSQTGGTVLMPRIVLGEGGDVTVAGSGVIKDLRLVGWLGELETRGVQWVTGEVRGGVVTLPCPDLPGDLSFDIASTRRKLEPRRVGDRIIFNLKLRVEGELVQHTCQVAGLTTRRLAVYESAVADTIKEEILGTFAKVQREFDADIFTLGSTLKKKAPRLWREVTWSREFSRMELEVEPTVFIRRTGISTIE